MCYYLLTSLFLAILARALDDGIGGREQSGGPGMVPVAVEGIVHN